MAGPGAGTGVVARSVRALPAPVMRLPALGGWVSAGLGREAAQRRLFPWLAVAFGAGALLFFTAADGAPVLAAPFGAGLVLAAGAVALRARAVAPALLLAAAFVLLGFGAAAWRVASVAAPVLTRTVIAPLDGFVEALEEREEGARLVIRVIRLGEMAASEHPARVRVSYRRADVLKPGDFIEAKARLLPPPEPARPGGYDFSRDAYFRGIGAVGSLLGPAAVKAPPEPAPWSLRAAAALDAARNGLTRRIAESNGGQAGISQAGAVAAALVTGKRGLIDQDTNDTLRAAGIYHVVSISGLHMVLAAGVVFWLARALLALVPGLALAWPIKKIAAGFAMVGVTAYCAFSGWDLAAERSLVMTLVMLGAILVDRPALSLRNLALAALLSLAREPEGLLGPSFQMSFGAVAGLVACARLIEGRLWNPEGGGAITRALAWCLATVVGTLATTLVAQIATAPFATYHFQTVQPFGLVGNALTLPLVSLVVMPAAVLGILAHPFALDRPVWWAMGLAVRGMLDISAWIQGFDRATIVLPAFGPGALGLMTVALLLLVLPASGLRWLGLAPGLLGLALAANPERRDLYVDREGGGAALRGADGRLVVLGRPPAFVLEQWLKADGDGRSRDDPDLTAGARCDKLGCVGYGPGGASVALVRDKRAFPEDCARATVLVTRLAAPPGCAAPHVLDKTFLAAHGATTLRFTPAGPVIETAKRPGEARPWRPAPVVATPPAALVPRPAPAPAQPPDGEEGEVQAEP
ncbi:ComEC/Rec2 family competence protein [Methylobacterium nonmethylotrophicum]|uniref:ComEC family competence protein n=1 Tax=Methylobacterium nonmethylotrophicum TaxID=1141884 RepID=A0A4Z0NJF4_9HYPH|nr:ComEC/Rec2 family competence protein [Methylobacterium nonmethylotrophicum]TGD95961.1 ComEC family competence protein [Methylobacterium nonmethylotrophicum]